MYIDPREVLIKRSDLLPVEDFGEYYLVDGLRYAKGIEDAAMHRQTATRLLSVAVRMEDEAKKVAAQKAKEWELEHAVPLARTMYNAFYNFSNSYRDREDLDEHEWRILYDRHDHAAKAWVASASAVLKEQEKTGE